jgi:putative ABC transport system permease protein
MTPPQEAPPSWARRIVFAMIPKRDRDFLVSDLDDEFAWRRREGHPALLWYFAQAVHAAWTRRHATRLVDPPHTNSGDPMIISLAADLRSAWRGFRGQPGITVAVILSLGLGIGTASAMFSVVRAVLMAPLPYRQPDRLVTVWSRWTAFDRTWLSTADVLDFKARSRAIKDIAVWDSGRVTLTGVGDAMRVSAGDVTANIFDVLGAAPIYGRVFTEQEAIASSQAGRAMFAVVSYNFWHGTLGADPAAVGRTIQIDDHDVTVLGVMPPHFQLPTDFTEDSAEPTVLWVPYYLDPATANHGDHGLYGAARLVAGATLRQLNDDLASISTDFVRTGVYPAVMHFTAFGQPIDDDVLGGVRPSMRVLLGAVMFLLLIACANAAALLVARAETRRREWTTRIALGAGRWRLLRLQLAEGILVAVTAGTLGIGLALASKRALDAIGPTAIPRASDVTVDWRVMLFMLGVSAASAILCSLAPAVHALRFRVVDGLKDGNTNVSAGRGRLRLRALLVVSQIALGLLLVSGAGLMARTLWSMRQLDLGFQPSGVLTARVALPASRYGQPAQVDAYDDAILGRLRQVPGVSSAGLIRSLPLATSIGDRGMTIEGYTPPAGDYPKGDWQVATPGALEALGEHLLRGRLFRDSDVATAPLVALVNETMAHAYWEGQDPIGRRVRVGVGVKSSRPWVTVVGIVADVRHNGLTAPIKTKFYLPYAQFPGATGNSPIADGTIVLRTDRDPLVLAPAMRAAAAAVDPQVPIAAIRPMTDVVDTALTAPRLTSQVMGGFAGVALVLSAIGLLGLLLYLVAQRTQEIGIRMAIGASRREVVRFVFVEGMRVTIVGVAIGLVLSALGVRALANLLYGVKPWDPLTWIVAPAVLVAVAAIACVVPAMRAAAIDPLKALRQA